MEVTKIIVGTMLCFGLGTVAMGQPSTPSKIIARSNYFVAEDIGRDILQLDNNWNALQNIVWNLEVSYKRPGFSMEKTQKYIIQQSILLQITIDALKRDVERLKNSPAVEH